MARINFVSKEEFVRLLQAEKDPTKRAAMKQLAHGAMYSDNPNTMVPITSDVITHRKESS